MDTIFIYQHQSREASGSQQTNQDRNRKQTCRIYDSPRTSLCHSDIVEERKSFCLLLYLAKASAIVVLMEFHQISLDTNQVNWRNYWGLSQSPIACGRHPSLNVGRAQLFGFQYRKIDFVKGATTNTTRQRRKTTVIMYEKGLFDLGTNTVSPWTPIHLTKRYYRNAK
jgi:hypothetical protein